MRTEISRRMLADPAEVFELARDVRAWATLLPHYLHSGVVATRGDQVLTTFIAVRWFGPVPFPVAWRAVCWSDAGDPVDLQLRFRHVRGVTRGMSVTWHVRPERRAPGGARVTIEHEFSRPLSAELRLSPDLLPRLVDRWFTRPIASRTLATFATLAEAHRAAGTAQDEGGT